MAKQKTSGPLDESHLKALDGLIKACVETDAYCQMCEDCNLDVQPEREKNRSQLDVARRIKARFFPQAK